jgi:purine-cytosine permease-like protein
MTFSPSSYNLGASLVSIGLLWWHGMIAAVIGSAILTILVVPNSRGAIKYFLGFPVYVRAAAGIRGASLYILVRAVVAIIYFATQTYYGGRITSVFMRGIFGNGYNNIPNHLSASAGITSRDLLSFFLFWMVRTLPLVAGHLQLHMLILTGSNASHVHSPNSTPTSFRIQSCLYDNCALRCARLGDQCQWGQDRKLHLHNQADATFWLRSYLAHDTSHQLCHGCFGTGAYQPT